MQGKFNPQIIKQILFSKYELKQSQRAIAENLGLALKTVTKYCVLAKKAGFVVDDLNKNADEIAEQIEPRFEADNKLRRKQSESKCLSKRHLSKALKKFQEEGVSISFCYRMYLQEQKGYEHFCSDYYRLELKKYLEKNLVKNIKISSAWNSDDVIYFAELVGPFFKEVMESVLNRSHISHKTNVDRCMRLISFISGDKNLYSTVENESFGIVRNPSLANGALTQLWKVCISYRDETHPKKWDSKFYEYKDRKFNTLKGETLEKFGLSKPDYNNR